MLLLGKHWVGRSVAGECKEMWALSSFLRGPCFGKWVRSWGCRVGGDFGKDDCTWIAIIMFSVSVDGAGNFAYEDVAIVAA